MIPKQLSDDVIMTEILSRTSLRTLDTIRCASKNFDSFTYESYFLNLYKQRNNIVSGFLVEDTQRAHEYINQFLPSPKSNALDLSFLPRNSRILATSEQGLIVIKSPDPSNCSKDLYHVCKPATNQGLLLPNPNSDYVTQKVAIIIMGLKPLNFKIIRLSLPLCYSRKQVRRVALFTTYYYEIFDSTTQAWTPPHCIRFPNNVNLDNAQPITTRGSIYMLLTNADILKFDAYLQKCTFLSPPILPTSLKQQCYTSKQLVKYEGKLGFTCINSANGCLEMWVLDIDESWEKVYVVNKQEDRAWKSFVAVYDSDTSIMVDGHTLALYKFKEGCNTNYKVVLNDCPSQMFIFRSDFEPIDSMHLIARS